MGASVDYLQRHATTGRLSYRRAIPANLRPFVPGQPREFKRSLGSDDIRDAQAMERFKQADRDYARLIAQAFKVAGGMFDTLDTARAAWIAAAYHSSLLAKDDAARLDGRPPHEDTLEAEADALRDIYGQSDIGRIQAMFETEALDIAEGEGWRLDTTAPEFRALCRDMVVAAITANDDKRARAAGAPVQTPPAPRLQPIGTALPGPAPPPSSPSFQSIAEGILTNVRLNTGIATAQATRTALRYFREMHGADIRPRDITRRHVSQWLDMLAQRPARLPYVEWSLPLPKLVERYTAKPDVPRLKGKTLDQAVSSLSAIWGKAHGTGAIDGALANPFSRHTIVVAPPAEMPQEMSTAELSAVFALPVFTAGQRPGRGKGEAAYWIPLLLLWTGARPEEIAQLMVMDVTQDADSGRWLLRITDEGTHPHKGPRTLKTSKSLSGRRVFPIPMAIIGLGFIAYVDWLKGQGETALFPRLRTKGERNTLFPGFGEWWSNYLRNHGVLPAGGGRKPAREFRHNWSTAARASGITEAAMEYIQGHSTAGKSANVRYGSRSPLGWDIDRLTFAALDLSGVRRWAAPSKP